MELQIYISMNSSQSYYIKEAVLISDSCGSRPTSATSPYKRARPTSINPR